MHVCVLVGGVCLVLAVLVSWFHFAQGSLVVCSLSLVFLVCDCSWFSCSLMDLYLEFRYDLDLASAAVIVACSPSISSFSVLLQKASVTSLNKNHVEKKKHAHSHRENVHIVQAYNDKNM